MYKINKYISCLMLLFFNITCSLEFEIDYSFIKDINNPSSEELKSLQSMLKDNPRRIALKPYLDDITDVTCDINFIDPKEEQPIKLEKFYVNTGPDDLEKVIISFASFNRNYPKGLERLKNLILKSDFKGHLITRLGGWPNIEDGSLRHSHIPYAFKVCFFKEVAKLGYKKILWLDSSIVPIENLNIIFEKLDKEKYLTVANWHTVGPYSNPDFLNQFEVSLNIANKVVSCQACVVGFDFSSKIGLRLFTQWFSSALTPFGFFSKRADQNALSLIFYKNKLCNFYRLHELANSFEHVNSNTKFVCDRNYVY
jgi:hypothetical protein